MRAVPEAGGRTSPIPALSSPTRLHVALPRDPPPPAVRNHAHEELKIKLRVLETKRGEELDKMRSLEARLRDAEEVARGSTAAQSEPPLPYVIVERAQG